MKKNVLFAIIGPSGAGKGTAIKEIKEKFQKTLIFPVSYTTRKIRENEKNGDVYYFITENQFQSMIENDEFLEYQKVHNNAFYGSSKKEILEGLKSKCVLREFDIQGFLEIKKQLPKDQLISIFIDVKDWETLEKRITNRSNIDEKELEKRKKSYFKEIQYKNQCTYTIQSNNNQIPELIEDFENIIRKYI